MRPVTALLDANIIYPAPLRDLFLQLALSELFFARWTADIHREWINALLRNEPHRARSALDRTRRLMDTAIPDALVTGYNGLLTAVTLPEANDRHILAAAIIGGCDIIVTKNIRDFPKELVDTYGISVDNPDDFLSERFSEHPLAFCEAARKVRLRLNHPPYSVSNYLDILSQQGLPQTVKQLTSHEKIL